MKLSQLQGLARGRITQAYKRGVTPRQEDLDLLTQKQTPIAEMELETSQPALLPPKTPLEKQNNLLVHTLQENTNKEQKRKIGGPEKEYKEFFENRFGPMVVLVLFLFFADMDKASFYAPNPDECKELAPHVAHLLAKYKLPASIERIVLTSDDSFALLFLTVSYLDRVGLAEKFLPTIVNYISGRGRKNGDVTRNTSPLQQQTGTASTGYPDVTTIPGLGANYHTDI